MNKLINIIGLAPSEVPSEEVPSMRLRLPDSEKVLA